VYKGDLDEVPIAPEGGKAYFTVVRGQEGRVKLSATLSQQPLVAPVPKGTAVGELSVMLGDKPLSSQPIVTQSEVKAGGYIHNLVDAIRMKL
jgi:D-alanyl-D-alanine carboxypeptidase (penicillin-binding protein 5/6)